MNKVVEFLKAHRYGYTIENVVGSAAITLKLWQGNNGTTRIYAAHGSAQLGFFDQDGDWNGARNCVGRWAWAKKALEMLEAQLEAQPVPTLKSAQDARDEAAHSFLVAYDA